MASMAPLVTLVLMMATTPLQYLRIERLRRTKGASLLRRDFYRLCLEIGMIFWDEAGSIAFTLHDAGKNPLSVAKVRSICTDYGLYLPEEVTSLRAAERAD